MSNWTLKELEGHLSKLEAEISTKEEAADELRHEIWKLTPTGLFYDDMFAVEDAKIGQTVKINIPVNYRISPESK